MRTGLATASSKENRTLMTGAEWMVWAAWPFASPAMLGWTAAAAIPLIIHLLSRRRYREAPWAAMQFLEAALRKHAQRWRLEQWLLLLVRMAVLTLLAVAVAQPLLSPQLAVPGTASPRTLWVLVFDESYSMNYSVEGVPLIEQARQQARQLIKNASQGDGFMLMTLGKPPRSLISDPTHSPEDVLKEIDALAPRDGGADLAATIRLLRETVQRVRRLPSRWDAVEVCIFSDLQALTWNAVQSPVVRDDIARLAELARIHLIDVDIAAWRNAGVLRLDFDRAVVSVGQEVRFVAQVKRHSPDQPQGGSAVWWIDEQSMGRSTVDLAPGASVISFSHRFTTPGWHTIAVQLPDLDPLTTDDIRYGVLKVREALRVLCVEGEPEQGKFVAIALQPQGSADVAVEVERAPVAAIREKDLLAYDVVFILNVASFSQAEAELLQQYVHAGGGLIFCLGDVVQPSNYNERFAVADVAHRLLPARLGERRGDRPLYFDPLAYRHPLVRAFEGHERAGLLTVPIRTYIALEPFSAPGVQVVLALQNGDPILVEHGVGYGRVMVLGTSVGGTSALTPDAWNDLAAWPSFVPLVHEMAYYVGAGNQLHYSTLVGEPITGPVPPRHAARFAVVSTPRQTTEHASIITSADDSSKYWRYEETWWKGFYQVSLDGSSHVDSWHAVNVDPAEGDLTPVDTALLPSQLHRGLPDRQPWPSGDAASATRSPWTKPLLALVFAFLLLDSFLGWSFGTARSVLASRRAGA